MLAQGYKNKHLLNGVVKFGMVHDHKAVSITHITEKLMKLKAYRLQLDHLGYCCAGGAICGREAITGMIHSQINKAANIVTPSARDRSITYTRCCLYITNKGWRTLEKYHKQAQHILDDPNQENQSYCEYTACMIRLIKANKGFSYGC